MFPRWQKDYMADALLQFLRQGAGAIRDTIPITQFNRGLAGKIFSEVRKSGAKVVMKNNTAECVLLSPEQYMELIEEINDARLLTVANERMEHFNPETLISEEEMDRFLGISEEDMKGYEEVEIG